MKKNIVVINQDVGYHTIDIINTFYESGKYDKIALITGRVVKMVRQLKTDITISKIKKYDRKTVFRRLFSWTVATFQITFLLLTKYRNYYVMYISNPPTNVFSILFCKQNFSSLIFDVYPDALVATNFIKESSFAFKTWSAMNKKFFAKAETVFTITEGMKKQIANYVEEPKIQVVSLWSNDFIEIPKNKEDNKFIKKYNFENKFIVMYSGNIGLGYNVDTLIDTAKLLEESTVNERQSIEKTEQQLKKQIVFVIIGEGWLKSKLEEKIKTLNLKNCILLPYQSVEMLGHSLSAADIGVVSIDGKGAMLSVPSKTYNLISLEIPLLAITSTDSELSKLISIHNIGKTIDKTKIEDIKNYILNLSKDSTLYNTIKENIKACKENYTFLNSSLIVDSIVKK